MQADSSTGSISTLADKSECARPIAHFFDATANELKFNVYFEKIA
jgi:hypothetical protein